MIRHTLTKAERQARVLKRITALAESGASRNTRIVAHWLKRKIEEPAHRTDEDRVLMILASHYLRDRSRR